MKSIGIQVYKKLYLMVKEGDPEGLLANLSEMKMKEPYLAEFLEEILIRRYFGKFYSNSYNFATILQKMDITENEYNHALYELISRDFIIKEKTKVYRLNDIAHTLTQEQINKMDNTQIR